MIDGDGGYMLKEQIIYVQDEGCPKNICVKNRTKYTCFTVKHLPKNLDFEFCPNTVFYSIRCMKHRIIITWRDATVYFL